MEVLQNRSILIYSLLLVCRSPDQRQFIGSERPMKGRKLREEPIGNEHETKSKEGKINERGRDDGWTDDSVIISDCPPPHRWFICPSEVWKMSNLRVSTIMLFLAENWTHENKRPCWFARCWKRRGSKVRQLSVQLTSCVRNKAFSTGQVWRSTLQAVCQKAWVVKFSSVSRSTYTKDKKGKQNNWLICDQVSCSFLTEECSLQEELSVRKLCGVSVNSCRQESLYKWSFATC